MKKDWRDYSGKLVTDRASAAGKDRNWPEVDAVTRELDETLSRRIDELARRVAELEKRSVG